MRIPHRPRRTLLVRSAFLLAVSANLSACGSQGGSAEGAALSLGRSWAERVDGIPNMARLRPGLYRGAQPDRDQLRWLRERGFKTVVNLRSHDSDREAVERLGMTCVEIPMKAGLFDADPPTEAQVRRFFEVVLDPDRRPLFFHCAQGKDRTGTMAALYRIEVDGWTPEEAIEEMQAFGYHDFYDDLARFVRSYEPRGISAAKGR